MTQVFNIENDAPTLVYPNGGEVFTSSLISIQWKEPDGIPSTEIVWYELFFTEDFSLEGSKALLQIATIPSGNSSFSYKIPKNTKGEKCRIGIRAVNHTGHRSPISYSADNFSIGSVKLPMPLLLDPVDGTSYFSYIPFVFDHSVVTGRCSQRAVYNIYYNCPSLNKDWTLLRSNILVGSVPENIDISDFEIASDYNFRVDLSDGNRTSEPSYINNISINHINYFLIDTVPPQGYVKVINNTEYTNDRNVLLQITAYDETSEIEKFRIEQTNIGLTETTVVEGTYLPISNISTWRVTGDDGVKLIQARFKDYAGNVIENAEVSNLLRTYKSLSNRSITAFLSHESDIYVAFASDEDTYSLAQLYKNQSFLSSLSSNATAMEYFDGDLYVAISDDEGKGILQRYDSSSGMLTVRDNDEQYADSDNLYVNSLYEFDSEIRTMLVYDDKLFMGLVNGSLLSFNGSTLTDENVTYKDTRIIGKLMTDNNMLYIFFENNTEIMVMYENEDEDYEFSIVETGN